MPAGSLIDTKFATHNKNKENNNFIYLQPVKTIFVKIIHNNCNLKHSRPNFKIQK